MFGRQFQFGVNVRMRRCVCARERSVRARVLRFAANHQHDFFGDFNVGVVVVGFFGGSNSVADEDDFCLCSPIRSASQRLVFLRALQLQRAISGTSQPNVSFRRHGEISHADFERLQPGTVGHSGFETKSFEFGNDPVGGQFDAASFDAAAFEFVRGEVLDIRRDASHHCFARFVFGERCGD